MRSIVFNSTEEGNRNKETATRKIKMIFPQQSEWLSVYTFEKKTLQLFQNIHKFI